MPLYVYRVAQTSGLIHENQAEAKDEAQLRNRLEKEGQLVLSVSEAERGLFSFQTGRRRFSEKSFLIFNQELLALLRAGLTVVKVLEILADRSSDADFAAAITRIGDAIKTGSAISDAMAEERAYFSELYISSLRAGEKSGNLIEIIERYISYQKKLLAVKKKVITALSYPCFLLIVGAGVVLFLLTYVMPTFSQLYADSRNTLPGLTQFFLNLTAFFRKHAMLLFAGLVLAIVTTRIFYRKPSGQAFLDRLLLTIPVLKTVMLKHYIIQMTRTLSAILKSGIPLLVALKMTADAMTNSVIKHHLQAAMQTVKEGGSLSKAFASMSLLPKVAYEMISVGEETGALEEILAQVADFHEEELDLTLSWITSLVEPILILVMGSVVGIILVAMYLPVFNLAETIQ